MTSFDDSSSENATTETITLAWLSKANGSFVTSTTLTSETISIAMSTVSTTNFSVPTTSLSSWLSTGRIQIILYIAILLLAIVGNALVILTLIQNRRMRTITNVFLLNLAISDILLGVLCMPITLVGTLLRDFVFGEVMCKLLPYLQGEQKLGMNFWIRSIFPKWVHWKLKCRFGKWQWKCRKPMTHLWNWTIMHPRLSTIWWWIEIIHKTWNKLIHTYNKKQKKSAPKSTPSTFH